MMTSRDAFPIVKTGSISNGEDGHLEPSAEAWAFAVDRERDMALRPAQFWRAALAWWDRLAGRRDS